MNLSEGYIKRHMDFMDLIDFTDLTSAFIWIWIGFVFTNLQKTDSGLDLDHYFDPFGPTANGTLSEIADCLVRSLNHLKIT